MKFSHPRMHSFVKRYLGTSAAFRPSLNSQNVVVDKKLGYWLLGVSGLVAGMVTVGGITRLTKSGLSMTDWKLQGSLPPLSEDDWNREFDRYKTFPEWQQRKKMTLSEFKFIYFWEYGHRMMGRFIGLAFVTPFAYFAYKKRIPSHMYPRLGLLLGLGGTQGLVGWWMVKSGLEMDPAQRKEIRVSPYRLATHLSFAFTTYGLLIWTGLDVLHPKILAERFGETLAPSIIKEARSLRALSFASGALAAATIVTGAFVAGNDAGKAYDTFPLFDDEWIPSSILEMSPLWRNFFENHATVQFDHRWLAMSTTAGVLAVFGKAFSDLSFLHALPKRSRLLVSAALGMTGLQVTLGITTIAAHVPIELAVLHQAGSLCLLTLLTMLCHSLRFSVVGVHAAKPSSNLPLVAGLGVFSAVKKTASSILK